MKLLVIQNTAFQDIYSIGHSFFAHKIEISIAPLGPEGLIDNDSNGILIRENHYFFEALHELENLNLEYDGILISHWLYPGTNSDDQDPSIDNNSYFSAVQLASFIRLSKKDYLRNSPILIVGPHSVEYILKESVHRPDILFASYGTTLKVISDIDWELDSEKIENDTFSGEVVKPSLFSIFKSPSRQDIELSFASLIEPKLVITDRSTNGHDVANYYGAYRLAELICKESLIKTPKNLYFHYLLSRTVKPDNSNIKRLPKSFDKLRVLVVDDQIEEGWSTVLNEIFKKGIEPRKKWTVDIEKGIKDGLFDLVLLDFRLEDGSGLNGLARLRQIKGEFEKDENGNVVLVKEGLNPVLPVIMFTASNKAWNMDKLYEAGADGYYVKEHPDTANDSEFSIKNYENLIATVKRCVSKGKLLKPYWKALNHIKLENHIGNSTFNEKLLSDGNWSNFKGRIEERILMFIGVLKKAFEQTDFDKGAFFYSEYELAFLTMWSVLNEFQECFFKKLLGFEYILGNPEFIQNFNEDEDYTPLVSSWLFGDTTPYITFKEERIGRALKRLENGFFEVKAKSNLNKKDWEIKRFDELREINWDLKISNHILFAIQNIETEKDITFIRELSVSLIELNKFRNKLFLTHGGAANSPNFGLLYQNNRIPIQTWVNMINKLFSIVYFLCTAKEWKKEM